MIKLGIVGVGRWAHAHALAAQRSERVELVTCFGRTREGREDFANELGLSRTSTSFEAMLADDGLDALIISTPNDLHVEMGLAAVAAGKPALLDKPVSVDLESGLALLRAAPSGATIGIAHHPRRLAGHRWAKTWLETEEGGDARIVHADFSNARGAAMKPDAWHRTVAGSEAGVLIQVGLHQIDNMLDLLGPAVAVNARFQHRTMGPMADAVITVIEHAGGAMSTVTSSWTTPSLYRFEIQSTGGNLRYRLDHRWWTSPDVDEHGELTLSRDHEGTILIATDPGDPLREQLEELGAAARGNGAMQVDVAAGLRSMAVVRAAVLSASQRGAPIEIGELLESAGATSDEVDLLTGVPHKVELFEPNDEEIRT
ncbi:MAG: putative dehydrogenase [Verrucomicrobiales bacterium]|jgi:predicted dehydrogenase